MDAPIQDFKYRYVPAPNAAQAPTLLLLHGTGGNESDLLDIGKALAPEANLLGVRGKVLENGAPRFFRRLAEGVFDIEDLHNRTAELAGFVTEASKTLGFDPNRVAAVGYSNGANIGASLLLSNPGVLSSSILLRPMTPFRPETLPDLANVPVFLAAGRTDPLVRPEETDRLASLLRDAGADVTVAFQNTGHGLTRADLDAAKTWWLHLDRQ